MSSITLTDAQVDAIKAWLEKNKEDDGISALVGLDDICISTVFADGDCTFFFAYKEIPPQKYMFKGKNVCRTAK